MIRPCALHPLISCMLLLLVCLSSSRESWPHAAHRSTPTWDKTDTQKVQLLEAMKMGILSSLGMDREPRPKQRATEQELRKMYQLYREKLREKRRNSSLLMSKTRQSTVSTLLLPATVEAANVLWRGEHLQPAQRMQWYRAVFHKNPHIHSELTVVSAELKITRLILNQPTSVQHEANQDFKFKVTVRKPSNLASWTHTDSLVHVNVSVSGGVVLDLSREVKEWMRSDGGQQLVVDVGVAEVDRDTLKANPNLSLALGLVQPKPAQRTRRSSKEDDCDERGWCCRRSVTVSFKEIGWTDWVVAPAEYTMNFCDGTCPHNYKPASMHTQVKSRLHQMTKGGTPRPCCVPAAYEPMVLMHYDSRGKLKLTPFDDFIVSKCHCA